MTEIDAPSGHQLRVPNRILKGLWEAWVCRIGQVVMAKIATVPLSHPLANRVAHDAGEQGRGSHSQEGFQYGLN